MVLNMLVGAKWYPVRGLYACVQKILCFLGLIQPCLAFLLAIRLHQGTQRGGGAAKSELVCAEVQELRRLLLVLVV